jgi:hypothetical protein
VLIVDIVVEQKQSQINDKVFEYKEYDRRDLLNNAIGNLEMDTKYQEYHTAFDKLLEKHR